MAVQSRVDAVFERPDEQGRSLAAVVMHRGAVVAERYVVPLDGCWATV